MPVKLPGISCKQRARGLSHKKKRVLGRSHFTIKKRFQSGSPKAFFLILGKSVVGLKESGGEIQPCGKKVGACVRPASGSSRTKALRNKPVAPEFRGRVVPHQLPQWTAADQSRKP